MSNVIRSDRLFLQCFEYVWDAWLKDTRCEETTLLVNEVMDYCGQQTLEDMHALIKRATDQDQDP